MAEIIPFRGIRYDESITGDLSAVVTPPYDVIKPEEQALYYRRSPYNIIRLEYGLTGENDSATNNRYTRAAGTLQRWLEEGALRHEDKKVFYVYEQTFTYRENTYRRTGLVAALKAEPYHRKTVLPHEETLQKAKSDRLQLLRHCRANFSPIFGLFADPGDEAGQIMRTAKKGDPLIDLFMPGGTERHILWALDDLDRQNRLIDFMASRPVFIADGHHRYETAVAFAGESDLKQYPGRGYVLSILVSLRDPGLVILPTHRVLKGLAPAKIAGLLRAARENFKATEWGSLQAADLPSFLAEIKARGAAAPAFGLITEETALLLQGEAAEDTLDVSILKNRLLAPLFADMEPSAFEEHVSYSKDEYEVLELIRCQKAQAAFLLNATPMQELTARASRGEKMPQKSTYFYPKLPSGLVIYDLDGP